MHKIYLIRHGETEATRLRKFEGSGLVSGLGSPLTSKGVFQALMVANALASKEISIVYASPLLRAAQTARIIAERAGVALKVEPDLREGSFGLWERLTFDEIQANYPEEVERWFENPVDFVPPQGESVQQIADRVLPCIDLLARELPSRPGSCAVVAHGGPIRAALSMYLSGNLEQFGAIQQAMGAINTLRFVLGVVVVEDVNAIPPGKWTDVFSRGS
ncbi:MAG: histidine phosphatase family protein [Clostridia bacterium]|nr:histidine phosphatase family protein [Clostridia bacterium]